MGEDGHIASLFPGDVANGSPDLIAAVERSDHPRLTWTPRALTDTSELVLAFSGAVKMAVLERALDEGSPKALPVRHLLRARARVLVCS
jgi:6-phosphogluconolactonase/glucosamine-6-phosphate isomerase/deaminase